MKTKFSIFKHFGRLPTNFSTNFNAMLGVKARPLLRKVFLGITAACKVRVSKSKFLQLTLLVSRLAYLRRTLGPKGLCLYLKAAFVLYQQSLGGHKLSDPRSVSGGLSVSRCNSGIPRIIPRELRREIRLGNTASMKLVSSILNVYRDIDFPGVPKLNTIIAPFSGDVNTIPGLQEYINPFLNLFYPGSTPFVEVVQGKVKIFHIWKAAPGMLKDAIFGKSNYSSHPFNVLSAFGSLYARNRIWEAFMTVITVTNNSYLLKLADLFVKFGLGASLPIRALGKLHAKEEAAGKVRLFAMADAPTQWACYPLHSAIMDQLKTIDQDGTFDQTRPLGFLDGAGGLYSYDLTAATDRLPLELQVNLLGNLIGDGFARAWATLLVGRPYGFYQFGYDKWHGSYKYAVGQPMGAYSSWAMLALTHHFLVQVSAWKAGVTPKGVWFTQYAVLGDDIVIGDQAVAQVYLGLLADLGMPVNLHKSLVSPKGTCMEFAKRTIYKGTDISPVPIQELGAAQGLATAMVQFGIKYSLTVPKLLQSFGYGWRDLSWLTKPLFKLPGSIRTLLLVLRMPKSPEELASFFSFGYKDSKIVHLDVLGDALKEQVMSKYNDRLWSELEDITWNLEANSYIQDPNESKVSPFSVYDLVREMVDSWYSSLYASINDVLPLPAVSEEGPELPDEESILSSWKLPTEQLEAFKATMGTPYEAGLLRFFSLLFESVSVPSINQYKDMINEATQNLEQRYSPEWSDAVWEDGGTSTSYDFFKRYWDTLLTLEEMSKVSPQSLEFERPEGMEGVALDYNAVTPIQVRFYRAWSALLVGSQDLLRARIVKFSPPEQVMPIPTPVKDIWSD